MSSRTQQTNMTLHALDASEPLASSWQEAFARRWAEMPAQPVTKVIVQASHDLGEPVDPKAEYTRAKASRLAGLPHVQARTAYLRNAALGETKLSTPINEDCSVSGRDQGCRV